MNKIPAERKEALLRQMMPPTNKSVSQIARESGISKKTLYTWRGELKGQGGPMPGNGKNAEEWSSEDKYGVVLETAPLNAGDLAEYCRRKGLFAEQIAAWRENCRSANANAAQRARAQREQSKDEQKQIRQLEKDLSRMEKALAEAAALLILRKKAQAIWGDKEES